MTVEELINKLKQYDPKAEITVFWQDEDDDFTDYTIQGLSTPHDENIVVIDTGIRYPYKYKE